MVDGGRAVELPVDEGNSGVPGTVSFKIKKPGMQPGVISKF
jgi:hypothetical protein